jgi:hypothetical protein
LLQRASVTPARRFGRIHPESVALLTRLSADAEVGGLADEALSDVATFADPTG